MTPVVRDIILSALEEWSESDKELSDVLYEQCQIVLKREGVRSFLWDSDKEILWSVDAKVRGWLSWFVEHELKSQSEGTPFFWIDKAIGEGLIRKAEVVDYLRKRLEEAK